MSQKLPIFRSDVDSFESFELLIGLYDLKIADIEDDYYILEGSPENLNEFRNYWIEIGGPCEYGSVL